MKTQEKIDFVLDYFSDKTLSRNCMFKVKGNDRDYDYLIADGVVYEDSGIKYLDCTCIGGNVNEYKWQLITQ